MSATLTSLMGILALTATPASIDTASFQFGDSVEQHADYFSSHCTNTTLRELDPAELPLATTSHVQIDCEGFAYFGAERMAEFVFADGALTHVWILVDAGELAALQTDFEAGFGTPDHETDSFVAFNDNNAAIRRDIPEALYYGDAAAPLFHAWFAQSAG